MSPPPSAQGLVQANEQAIVPSTSHLQIRFGEPSQMQRTQPQAAARGQRIFGFFNQAPPVQQSPMALPQSSAAAQGVAQSSPNVQHGYAYVPTVAEVTNDGVVLYRPTAQPTFVSNPPEQAVVQQDAQNAVVRHGEAELAFGTRVANHLPLGPGDGPGEYGSYHRRNFRLMLDAANKLDTLCPDLEYARSINWTSQISNLERQIYHWQSDIAARLAKSQDSIVFQQLLLTYPQVHKHVAPSFLRQRLPAPPAAPRARTVKSEDAPDDAAAPPVDFFKQEEADRLASLHASRQPVSSNAHSGGIIKREEPSAHAILAEISPAPQNTCLATAYARQGEAASPNADIEASDSDDCVIIAERRVNARLSDANHLRSESQRTQEATTRDTQLPRTSDSSVETRPNRYPRTSERPWSTEPESYRSTSPQARGQTYRERSPRRDAIVEELFDLE